MEKKDEKDLTTEVFENLQRMAGSLGGKASLTLDRPDGWKWQLVDQTAKIMKKTNE